MQSSERTYQFISDPTHKENLSGRVTAACLNCRRKKIKCSGEVDCVQCQEKGLHCEGPPSRKRPRRDNAPSTSVERNFIKEAPSEQASSKRKVPPPISIPHEDSGYASFTLGSAARTSRTPSATESYLAAETATTGTNLEASQLGHSTSLTLTTSQPEAPESQRASFSSTQYPSSQASPSPTYSTSGATSDVPVSATGSQWSFAPSIQGAGIDFQDYVLDSTTSSDSMQSNTRTADHFALPGDWWTSQAQNSQEYPSSLLNTAEALEAQAQNLRLLASRHQSLDSSGSQQMPQFDSQVASSTGQDQNSLTQFTTGSSASMPGFDASAWFRPDGSLRSGFTPGVQDYSSFMQVGEESSAPQSGKISQMSTQSFGQLQDNLIGAVQSSKQQRGGQRSQIGQAEELTMDAQISPHGTRRSSAQK